MLSRCFRRERRGCSALVCLVCWRLWVRLGAAEAGVGNVIPASPLSSGLVRSLPFRDLYDNTNPARHPSAPAAIIGIHCAIRTIRAPFFWTVNPIPLSTTHPTTKVDRPLSFVEISIASTNFLSIIF
jgi:hypothetical protein